MPDSTLLRITLLSVLAIAGAIAYAIWYYRRARELLQSWADQHGFQIQAVEHRWLNRGPFFWTTSRGQVVYYVTVLDTAGRKRRGYVRCGSFWGGLFSDKVEVRWDEIWS
jgi:hypothetical protein